MDLDGNQKRSRTRFTTKAAGQPEQKFRFGVMA